jgi:hypothetical protein
VALAIAKSMPVAATTLAKLLKICDQFAQVFLTDLLKGLINVEGFRRISVGTLLFLCERILLPNLMERISVSTKF